jgi:hypothetical protein
LKNVRTISKRIGVIVKSVVGAVAKLTSALSLSTIHRLEPTESQKMKFLTFLDDAAQIGKTALLDATEVAAVAEPVVNVLEPTYALLYDGAVNLFLAGQQPGQTSTQELLNVVAATAALIQQIKGGAAAAAASVQSPAQAAPAVVLVSAAPVTVDPAPAVQAVAAAPPVADPAPAVAQLHPAVAAAAAALSASLASAPAGAPASDASQVVFPGPGLHNVTAA